MAFCGSVEHINEVFIGVQTNLIFIFIEVGKTIIDWYFREVSRYYSPQFVERFSLVFDNFVLGAVDQFDHFLGLKKNYRRF